MTIRSGSPWLWRLHVPGWAFVCYPHFRLAELGIAQTVLGIHVQPSARILRPVIRSLGLQKATRLQISGLREGSSAMAMPTLQCFFPGSGSPEDAPSRKQRAVNARCARLWYRTLFGRGAGVVFPFFAGPGKKSMSRQCVTLLRMVQANGQPNLRDRLCVLIRQ